MSPRVPPPDSPLISERDLEDVLFGFDTESPAPADPGTDDEDHSR